MLWHTALFIYWYYSFIRHNNFACLPTTTSSQQQARGQLSQPSTSNKRQQVRGRRKAHASNSQPLCQPMHQELRHSLPVHHVPPGIHLLSEALEYNRFFRCKTAELGVIHADSLQGKSVAKRWSVICLVNGKNITINKYCPFQPGKHQQRNQSSKRSSWHNGNAEEHWHEVQSYIHCTTALASAGTHDYQLWVHHTSDACLWSQLLQERSSV